MQRIIGSETLPVPVTDYDEATHGEMANRLFKEGAKVIFRDRILPPDESLRRDNGNIFAARDGKLVGMLEFAVPHGHKNIHLSGLYVDPATENSRRVTQALVAAAMSIANEHKIDIAQFKTRTDVPRLLERYRELADGELVETEREKRAYHGEKGLKKYEVSTHQAQIASALRHALKKGGKSLFDRIEIVLDETGLGFPDEELGRAKGLIESFLDGEDFRTGSSIKFYGIHSINMQRAGKDYLVTIFGNDGNRHDFMFSAGGEVEKYYPGSQNRTPHETMDSITRDGLPVTTDENERKRIHLNEILESALPIKLTDKERRQKIDLWLNGRERISGEVNGRKVELKRKEDETVEMHCEYKTPIPLTIKGIIEKDGSINDSSAQKEFNAEVIDFSIRYLQPEI